MRIALVGVALLVLGCGRPFTGVWAGTVTQSLSCDNGSTEGFQFNDQEWVLADTEKGGIRVATGGDCGVLYAQSVSRLTANITGQGCKGSVGITTDFTENLTGGTLDMDESMSFFGVTMQSARVYTNSTSGNRVRGCDVKWGALFVFKDRGE